MQKKQNIIALIILLFSIHVSASKYVISFRDAGFYSNFIQILNNLYYCHRCGLTPVIYWGSDCYYYDKHGWNGVTHNAWEYYFEPVSGQCYNEGDATYNSYWAPNKFTMVPAASPHISREMREVGNQIIAKYIRIKKPVLDKIDSFINEYFTEKYTIGIHYRGTDKFTSHEAREVDMKRVISAANDHAKKHAQSQFYIATDQHSFLVYAQKNLIAPVIYWDSFRSTNSLPIHKKPSMAQIGQEALIDMVLLSRCNFLIRTSSNLSTVSLIFNPKLPDQLVL